MRNIVPRIPGVNTLGTPEKRWGAIYADQIVLPDNKTLLEILSRQDTTIEEVLGQQNLAIANALAAQDTEISNRLGEQDAEIDSRLSAQESTINQLSAQKVNKADVYTKDESDSNLALKANQADLEALAGNTDVVASGDNYIRYANGLQICWDIIESTGASINANATASLNKNFPVAFKSAPHVALVSRSQYFMAIYNSSTSSTKCYATMVNVSSAAHTLGSLAYIAIGYWK